MSAVKMQETSGVRPTSDVRPLADAELDHVSGGGISGSVLNQKALSLPKPAYPPIA